MKNRIARLLAKSVWLLALIFLTFCPLTSPAQVSISININYNTYPGQSSYYIQIPITTTNPILTYDEVISPNTNFAASVDSNGFGGDFTYAYITRFSDLANAITNGHWLFITDIGTPSEKDYPFQVSLTDFTSNDMPGFQVTYPMPEEAITDTNVTFTWADGPTNYIGLGLTVHNTDYSFYEGVGIDPAYYSSWNFGTPLSGSDTNFYFDVNYETSGTNFLAISTPLTTNGLAVPGGWSATSTLNLVENNGTNADGDGVHFTLSPEMTNAGADFNAALDTTNLPWSTGGDTDWFVETTNTYSGDASAAQSGSVTNQQSSTLSVTVNGPGVVTFYWSSIANDPNGGFYCEFYMDGDSNNDVDAIYGDTPWYQDGVQDGPFYIPAGQHSLDWTVFAGGDTDPTQAAFLDQVSYIADTMPVITSNPFNQTNYPGYPVWLSAVATGNPAPTWQWYETGSGAIAGATSFYFIPTNAGTAGVAGGYYAVASNPTGSATTLTAAVTFVSAPLPPGWLVAVKSPFSAEYGTNVISDYYAGCAVDSAGNVYAADQYNGDVNVESNFVTLNTLTAAGKYGAAALVKSDPAGHVIWAVGLTNNDAASYSYGLCVALAPGNGAYLFSDLIGTNWLGTNRFANNGGDSVLLSRFDANGSNLWSKFIGPSNTIFTVYNDLVADASGNVTIAGLSTGTIDFGGTNLTAPGGFGGFMAQYDSNGVVRWAQTFPGFPQNMAESGGQIYVSFSSSTVGGVTNLILGSLSNLTDRAYGLAAVNAATGQALWLRGVGEQFGAKAGGFSDDVPLISVAGADVFLTGTAYGSSAVFGGLSVPVTDGRSQYFARYDTSGNAQTATNCGGPTTMPWAAAADSSGVYISGDFDYSSYFGNYLIAAPEFYPSYLGFGYFTQPFVAKFDRNGNALWALNGVSSLLANFRGVATAPDGVWASGIVYIEDGNLPAQFGAHTVGSDGYLYYFGTGVTFFFTQGGLLTKITETAAALPVTLLHPQIAGTNFQFQFQSQSAFTYNVLYRTNLAIGAWLTNSTVAGTGAVLTDSIPLSVFSPSKAGFVRVSTQ